MSALYRLPFHNRRWTTGGNWDAPGGHGGGQPYAYDMGPPAGSPDVEDQDSIRAARAGVVIVAINHIDRNVWDLPSNDPLKGKLGGGNAVLIRHADNTVAAYLHMRHGSVTVRKDQWVPQGFVIGRLGNTGNSSHHHLHFDVRLFWKTERNMGPMLVARFEDEQRAAFRPRSSEPLFSNNRVYRQDAWRRCQKCQALYFGPLPSKCPATKSIHVSADEGQYVLELETPGLLYLPRSQKGWRWCDRCQGLWFTGGQGSRCPAVSGAHRQNGSGHYVLDLQLPPGPAARQGNWRLCSRCHGLWYGIGPGSVCPAPGGGPHKNSGNATYWLSHVWSLDNEAAWRRCSHCRSLFKASLRPAPCPAGARHSGTGSGNYVLTKNCDGAPGQEGWAQCRKCYVLWYTKATASHCAVEGAHDSNGTARYTMVPYAAGVPGENNWRRCQKCQSMYSSHNGPWDSLCPKDKKKHAAGPEYAIQF